MHEKTHKLLLELQNNKSKQIYQDLVDCKINILMAKLQLKTLVLCKDTMNLIIDYTIIRYTMNTDTLDMYDINIFHP